MLRQYLQSVSEKYAKNLHLFSNSTVNCLYKIQVCLYILEGVLFFSYIGNKASLGALFTNQLLLVINITKLLKLKEYSLLIKYGYYYQL